MDIWILPWQTTDFISSRFITLNNCWIRGYFHFGFSVLAVLIYIATVIVGNGVLFSPQPSQHLFFFEQLQPCNFLTRLPSPALLLYSLFSSPSSFLFWMLTLVLHVSVCHVLALALEARRVQLPGTGLRGEANLRASEEQPDPVNTKPSLSGTSLLALLDTSSDSLLMEFLCFLLSSHTH